MTTEELVSTAKVIADKYLNNQADRDLCNLKLAEECSELSAQLIQKTLHPFHTPDNSEIIDEMGDVYVRMLISVNMLSKDDQFKLQERIDHKMGKALKRVENG